jgi:lysine decarboxylase
VLKQALAEGPLAAVVLVDPTYEGLAGDLVGLVAEIRRAEACGGPLPVLVDQAHGRGEALAAGADLTVLSLQKSAGGLAQSAALLGRAGRFEPAAVARALLWLQTSSPSALLLASAAAALEELRSEGGRRRRAGAEAVATRLRHRLAERHFQLVANADPLRLVLATAPLGISGFEADARLQRRGVIAELPGAGTVTFCLGMAPPPRLARRLTRALEELRREVRAGPVTAPLPPLAAPPVPLVATPELPLETAWRARHESLPPQQAAGRIAAEPVCPYPPGIPLLIPGERIDAARALWLARQNGLWPGSLADTVKVVAER